MLLFAIFSNFLPAQIVLNEFMIDPDNDNTGEFIEIFNASDSCLDLSRYYICDEQDTDAIVPFPDSVLGPESYGLILDPDYAGEYDDLVPDSIPVFTVSDARFGMYGISNSTSKRFAIVDNQNMIVDSYMTGSPIWPSPGYSIERTYFDAAEWLESTVLSGTPGFRNSTAAKDLDLAIVGLQSQMADSCLHVSFHIKNTGLLKINDFRYGYIVDIPFKGQPLSDTTVFTLSRQLPPRDSIQINMMPDLNIKGHVSLYVFAFISDLIGDTLALSSFIPLREDDLIINEFLVRTGDNFTAEYVEVLSLANRPLSLQGLEICDLTGAVRIDSNVVLSPDSLLVFAQSASFHDDFPFVNNVVILTDWRNLNNGEDLIRFQNPDGSHISELHYNQDWDIPNDASMELVDHVLDYRKASNWDVSVDGSPGKPNPARERLQHLSVHTSSRFYTPLDLLSFDLINDGYLPVDSFTCTFATPRIQQYFHMSTSEPGDTLRIEVDTAAIFDPGTQICSLYCETLFTFTVSYYYPYEHSPCYINEVLFDPINTYGQAEFIELTCSQKPFNLDHWSIKVNNSILELEDTLINMYTCVCDPEDRPGSSGLTYAGFPALPNAGAELFLLDPMGRIMDYADLREHPDIQEGRSLEKQFPGQPSNDPDLWLTSVANNGMTPGKMNSVSALPGVRTDLGIYPECFDPDHDERIQFSIDSDDAIEYCEIFCFNLAGQLIYRHEQNVFSHPSFLHFWDGRMENGDYPSRGLYLVLAIVHHISGHDQKLKKSFIVR